MTNQGTGIMFYNDFGRKVKRLKKPKEVILDKPRKKSKKAKKLRDDRQYIATASS
jgi:hypothetical protein